MSERLEQELIERIAYELRAGGGIRFDAAFDERVMAAIRREALAQPVLSLHAPREQRSRHHVRLARLGPLVGLAAAAAFAGFLIGGSIEPRSSTDVPAASAAAAGTDARPVRVVQFVLRAPDASSVALVGDFNEWNAEATPLSAVSSDGVWTVALPLPVGRHVYAFVVDGEEWRPDPSAPKAPGDDFGVPNSVVTVGAATS